MIGGYYVLAIEPSTAAPGREYTSLIVGPFGTWAEAEAIGPKAIAHVNQKYTLADKLSWSVCEFFAHRLVLGVRNAELWVKATPMER